MSEDPARDPLDPSRPVSRADPREISLFVGHLRAHPGRGVVFGVAMCALGALLASGLGAERVTRGRFVPASLAVFVGLGCLVVSLGALRRR